MPFADPLLPLIYATALLLVWLPYGLRRKRRSGRARDVIEASKAQGLMEPASLHPIIDGRVCMGCGTCVAACPERDVLGLIDGKAALITPANCIGHGVCKDACPTGALTLVLGTKTRGVDIPVLDAGFQTNVPGIFVAGELGGMGLIRNAIEQGRLVIDSIRRSRASARADCLDVLIVGAGPAGFSASLAAIEHGLRSVTLEQETLGGTVNHYPRGKIVMTAPVHLPLYGMVRLRETTKEALLDFWAEVARKTRVRIRYRERVESISRRGELFEVVSNGGVYRARSVVLAIGRRGTPRKLGVRGEELDKVVYRLIEPEQYRGRKVLVVGGGDSALEAATTLAEEPGTGVVLAYRNAAFSRAKAKNRTRLETAARAGRVGVMLNSHVVEIARSAVQLQKGDRGVAIENDSVLVCAGGIVPNAFLESVGVKIQTKYGTE